ncbi:MAG: adenylate/guanylate cyclase domain-containing protein [Hyphomicrobiales bacterium]|nr:adenylate/guanylate cyclase domain-containing protein [Hyphomicrobiales bacterium]
MTQIDSATDDIDLAAPRRPGWRTIVWSRLLRLGSGLVLFTFLTMHLLNHAAGLFGIEILDAIQTLRWEIWHNPIGLTLLYGSFAVHIGLALFRIVTRRTLRMTRDEMTQIALGLLIPVLLLQHIIATRVAGTWFDGNSFYDNVLRALWPGSFLWQSTLVLVSWFHGVIGIVLAFRHRPWFARIRTAGAVLAIVVPTLAIAGFIASGRETALRPPQSPPTMTAEQTERVAEIRRKAQIGLGGIAALLLAALYLSLLRQKIGDKITITYRGRGPVRAPRGMSVLETSRVHGIPHPSLCRGRGRCSTCRVQILSDPEALPPPSEAERQVLDRVGSHADVRLACQLRPTSDVTVRILLPVIGAAQDPESRRDAERWAAERVASILSLDLRGFNVLAQSNLPYELVALVNRFGNEMRQAVKNHGGHVSTFYGDGLIAVFENAEDPRAAARQAIAAARDMGRVLKILNRDMGGALPIPIRAGIGIHSGTTTLARIGSTERDSGLMAFGPTVSIAARLQDATKRLLTDCLISAATLRLARIDTARLAVHEIEIENMDDVLRAHAVDDWRVLRGGEQEEQDAHGDREETERA